MESEERTETGVSSLASAERSAQNARKVRRAGIIVKFCRFFEELGKITGIRGFSKRDFKRKYRQNSEARKFAYLR